MPKLPDRRVLGSATPSAVGPHFSPGEAKAAVAGVGKPLQVMGSLMTNIGEAEQRKQDDADLIKADAILKEQTARFERAFDKDEEYETYGKKYETGSAAIRSEAAKVIRNGALRQKFVDKTTGWHGVRREDMIERGLKGIEQRHVGEIERGVESGVKLYSDPGATDEQREQAKRDIEARIELARRNGSISLDKAEKMRKAYLPKLALQDIHRRMSKGPEEQRRLFELAEKFNKAKPADDQIRPGAVKIDNGVVQLDNLPIEVRIDKSAPYMKRKRKIEDLKGGEIILHGTDRSKGTDWFVRYGQRVDPARGFDPGYHFYIAPDGKIIQGAPLDRITNGALNRNKRQVHIALIGADGTVRIDGPSNDPTTEQDKAVKALISGLGPQLGIPHSNIHGHGEIQGNRNKREAGTIAAELRAQGFTSQDGEGVPETPADPDMEEARSLFGSFTATQRAKLTNALRRQAAVAEEDQRQTFKNAIESHISSIRRAGVGVEGADDAFTKLSGLRGTKNYIIQAREKIQLAKAYHENTKDLSELTPEQIEARRDALVPLGGDPKHATKWKILQEYDRAASEALKQRAEDPAAAADQTAVMEAFSRRQVGGTVAPENQVGVSGSFFLEGGGQTDVDPAAPGMAPVIDIAQFENKDSVIAARLEAQERLGVPETERRTITKKEAMGLVPDIRGLDERQAMAALTSAARRIGEQYGEFADDVLRDALLFRRIATTGDKPGAVILQKVIKGQIPTRQDIALANAYKAVEFEDSVLGINMMTDSPFARQTAGYNAMLGMSANPQTPAIAQSFQQAAPPNRSQLDWAMEDPETRAPLFDEMFGAGAFDAAVRYTREQTQ